MSYKNNASMLLGAQVRRTFIFLFCQQRWVCYWIGKEVVICFVGESYSGSTHGLGPCSPSSILGSPTEDVTKGSGQ